MFIKALLFLTAVLAFVPHVIWFIGWIGGLIFGYHIPYAPFGWTAMGLVALLVLTLLYGYEIGRFKMEVTHHEFNSVEVPAELDGYRIVHISDLHLSTFDDHPEALQRTVDSINAQKPDLICFTGDMVSLSVAEIRPYVEILKGLHATDGVCSVLGNHDFLIYNRHFAAEEEREKEVERLADIERDSLGWNVLRNTSRCLRNSALTMVGVDNCACTGQGFHTIYAGDLHKAMEGTKGLRVLLSHDPSHWRAEVVNKQPIALTLSGHTHSGQVRVFGWPLSSVIFHDNEGWYYDGQQSLYINRGIGCTLPMRLNCPQEITVITLRKRRN